MVKRKQADKKLIGKKITRKQAIKKVGITALTTSSLLFLQTKAGAQDSHGSGEGLGNGRGGRG